MNREREVNEWVSGCKEKREEEDGDAVDRGTAVEKDGSEREEMARRRDKRQTRSMYRATHQIG